MPTNRRAPRPRRAKLSDEIRDELRERFGAIVSDIAALGGTPGDAVKLFGEALQDNLEDSAVLVTKQAAKAVLERLFG
jgi:hypothetical protein